jgi:hypothetical protein
VQPEKSYVVGRYECLPGLGERVPLNDLLEKLAGGVTGLLA